jgi:hypothetical protein
MLLLAPTYSGRLRSTLLVNAVFGPLLFLQPFWPALAWVTSLRPIVFPATMLMLARHFANGAEPSPPRLARA